MKTIRHRYGEIGHLFPGLQPLRSPKSLVEVELALAGYWTSEQHGKFYLVMSYLPPDHPTFTFGLVRPPQSSDLIDVEEYDDPHEWQERMMRLTGAPSSGSDEMGSGVRLRPMPPTPAAGAAQQLPVNAPKDKA